jgi:hypothetical protein
MGFEKNLSAEKFFEEFQAGNEGERLQQLTAT